MKYLLLFPLVIAVSACATQPQPKPQHKDKTTFACRANPYCSTLRPDRADDARQLSEYVAETERLRANGVDQ